MSGPSRSFFGRVHAGAPGLEESSDLVDVGHVEAHAGLHKGLAAPVDLLVERTFQLSAFAGALAIRAKRSTGYGEDPPVLEKGDRCASSCCCEGGMGQVDQATDAKLNRDQLGKKDQTMRRTRVSLAVASVFLLGLVVTGQQVTVEGELVSAKCYLRADLTGNDHLGMEGCGTACVRSGNPVGLLTAEGM